METVDWDTRPFEPATLIDKLSTSAEGEQVRRIRALYGELLRREATAADCSRVRAWVDGGETDDRIRRDIAALPEARRVSQVRQAFVGILGRDPVGWDDGSLRWWVDSPFTLAEIKSRLAAQRPLVGIHYFLWYQPRPGGWGNNLNSIAADSPKPAAGWYDSSDTGVMAEHIAQMEAAGFDFVIVHVVTTAPRTWTNARTFFDRLSGHRLRAVILLDGLYADEPASKAMWVQKVKSEFTGDSHYLRVHGQPLVALYSSPLDFDVPGVTLRNIYWTDNYAPGRNSFNPSLGLEPRDWPFWAPTPQPLVNGVVPVIPGYTDAALGRPRTMVHDRAGGQTYREQWQEALARRPEFIVVYGWNEYFERTAIEPTDAWGNQYLQLSACFIGHAHRGTKGPC